MQLNSPVTDPTRAGTPPSRPLSSGLGKLYGLVGQHNRVHTELATAVSVLCEIGMAFGLPEAEQSWPKRRASNSARMLPTELIAPRPMTLACGFSVT